MAESHDVSTSIIASDGRDIRTGILSLLQNKENFLFKSGDYMLIPLYWKLVVYGGTLYMLGHKKQRPGQKPSKTLTVKGCSTDFDPPAKATVSGHSNETFLCIQNGGKITFLKAENRRSRDKWVADIRSALMEPIYHPSSISTTSTDRSTSIDALDHVHHRLPISVRGTADTKAKAVTDWRRNNTSPAGQFSVPSSANALAMEKRRSREIDSNQSPLSHAEYLQSSVISRPRSLNSIDAAHAQYSGFEYFKPGTTPFQNVTYSYSNSSPYLNNLGNADSPTISQAGFQAPPMSGQSKDCNVDQQTEILPLQSKHTDHARQMGIRQSSFSTGDLQNYANFEQQNPNIYMSLMKQDDELSVSFIQNLKSKKPNNLYDDTAAPVQERVSPGPPVPQRDYVKPIKTASSKKKRAPQPPTGKSTTPISSPKIVHDEFNSRFEQMDSIEREKTVVLGEPLPCQEKTTNTAPLCNTTNAESLEEYVMRFRGEQFDTKGITITIPKTDLKPENITLACVGDYICVASLPSRKLHSKLHVDDVILKVNSQTLLSIEFCYDLFRTTDCNLVKLLVRRVYHGVMSCVVLPGNGDLDSLGIQFGNESQGNEVTGIQIDGLVARSGNLARPQTSGVTNRGMPVNWGLIEINQTPVSLESTNEEVRKQLCASGCELVLVFIPMDIVQVFKRTSYSKEDSDIYESI